MEAELVVFAGKSHLIAKGFLQQLPELGCVLVSRHFACIVVLWK
jgi:hypothetical protein